MIANYKPWTPPEAEETEDMSNEHRVLPTYAVNQLDDVLAEYGLEKIVETLAQFARENAMSAMWARDSTCDGVHRCEWDRQWLIIAEALRKLRGKL
jgi:hypothetical protein